MDDINFLAVAVATVVAFMVGAIWYGVIFGKEWLRLRGLDPKAASLNKKPPASELVGELGRNLVVAFVLAYFIDATNADGWIGAVAVGLWVWVGFQAMLLLGSVLHEKMPWKLYAIHAGDALAKTLLTASIIGAWR